MSVNSKMTAIADAIRLKTGRTDTLTLDEMASALNNIPTQTAKTITPGTVSQTAINSGTFATGKVTVKGDNNLKAENIVSGKSIFGVSGTYIGADTDIEDGLVTRTLTTYSNSRVQQIGKYAFYSYSSLRSIECTKCNTILNSAFQNCTSLTTINFPACTNIYSAAFQNCTALTTINVPACTYIDQNVFSSCTALRNINLSACKHIGSRAFTGCTKLTTVTFPVCTNVYTAAFATCPSLVTVDLPACTTISGNAFAACDRLTAITLPACTNIGTSAFYACYKLATVTLPACTNIGSYAFSGCGALASIYLTGSSICTLAHSNAFSRAGITSSTGAIYVPLSLGWSYKNATNWTYFFNRIFSIEGEEIVEPPISFTIDGIAYEATIGSIWSDWVISDYNTADFKINGAAIVSADGSVQISGVIASDLIEENYNYETRAIGAFGDPITFYVRLDAYTALDGMTWADWVSSEYNSSNDYYRTAISVDMENNIVKYGDMDEIIVNEDWEVVTPYDLIIANMQYETELGDLGH